MDKAATKPTRTALLAGGTGLVGRELLGLLLAAEAYASVLCLVRRPLALQHPKLTCKQVDFSALGALPPVDDVFIALGTTIKAAGSQAAFRAVDFDAVLAVAQAARAGGATRLGVVSAMGASPRSGVFYNRVKGEMEEAVSALGYDSVVIARPSFLAGDRASLGQPLRPGEKWALMISDWLGPLIPANYRAIQASQVARGLFEPMRMGIAGRRVLLSGALRAGD